MTTKALKKMWREWAKDAGEHLLSFRKWCALMANNAHDAEPEEIAASLWLTRKGWRF